MIKKIPYEELYRMYTRDRRLKERPFITFKRFKKTLDVMNKTDPKGFEKHLELSGWKMYK